MTLTLSLNGETYNDSTTFNTYTPQSDATLPIRGTAEIIRQHDVPNAIGLMNPDGVGVKFSASVSLPQAFSQAPNPEQGQWFLLQLSSLTRRAALGAKGIHNPLYGQWGLDGSWPYPAAEDDPFTDSNAWATGTAFHHSYDSPRLPLQIGMTKAYIDNDEFVTYVMFQPPGTDSEWVPLRSVAWGYSVAAVQVAGQLDWRYIGVPEQHIPATFGPAGSPPIWTQLNPAKAEAMVPDPA